MKFCQVAVNIPRLSGVFDYHIPAEWEGAVRPGCLVVAPFGRQTVQGVVLRAVDAPQVLETRPLLSLLDGEPVLTQAQMDLALWLEQQTLTPLPACLDIMLPPGLTQQADTLYSLSPAAPPADEPVGLQGRLLNLLRERGSLRARQIETAFPHQNARGAARALIKVGWLLARPVLPPPTVRPKMARSVRLVGSAEEALAHMDKLGRGAALERRQALLRFLMAQENAVNAAWACEACGGNLQDLQKLAGMGLVALDEVETWRDPLQNLTVAASEALQLTPDQQAAWQKVEALVDAAGRSEPVLPALLYGVTGSGKTEIYLRAVEKTLAMGRQAIVLVPEISLTPQTVARFSARFPGQVGVIHSRLTSGERFDTWRRARSGRLRVIVGARSALFTPFPDIGLIVIDEFDDSSYYQNEPQPAYHAVRAALAYAGMAHSAVLLGSATPDVEMRYRAEREGWPVLRLPQRVAAHIQHAPPESRALESLPMPLMRVIDMRLELKAGNMSIFSTALRRALSETLERRQQAILFINRRGSATFVFCRACGYSLRCPRCDLPLTLHTGEETSSPALICHNCSYQRQPVRKCPSCGSDRIRHYGSGTEKVEDEIKALFPQAVTMRWDADSARRKGAHDELLSRFVHHEADVLIGTRMVAKGLDLPLVTLVGVVLADVGLNFPDYRAGERVFQLLTQVAGRSGRSPLGGQAILQTFQPDHYVIRCAARYDGDGFYQQELDRRRMIRYPPFYRLARLEYRHRDAAKAGEEAEAMKIRLLNWIAEGSHRASELIGPAPCYFGKTNGLYRWQIILRSPDPAAVLRGRRIGDWRLEIDPLDLL